MLPLLTATRFLKAVGSGRTQPCLMVGWFHQEKSEIG